MSLLMVEMLAHGQTFVVVVVVRPEIDQQKSRRAGPVAGHLQSRVLVDLACMADLTTHESGHPVEIVNYFIFSWTFSWPSFDKEEE